MKIKKRESFNKMTEVKKEEYLEQLANKLYQLQSDADQLLNYINSLDDRYGQEVFEVLQEREG